VERNIGKNAESPVDISKKPTKQYVQLGLWHLVATSVLTILITAGAYLVYTKYYKKIYVVDYTQVINRVKGDIERAALSNNQFLASLKVKQLQQIASETDGFCKFVAEENGIEVYAANLVFAPKNRVVDVTSQLIEHLQNKKLIDANTTTTVK